jgi:uncharacterized protein (TIGR03083 family)
MPLAPVDTAPLFAPLHAELLGLLRSLSARDWLRPTIAPRWRVRDVAAHLLDGDLRYIATYRDGHFLPLEAPIASAADLSRLVNGLNGSGVEYAARLSPRQLMELLGMSGQWVNELVTSLPLHGKAIWSVSWAGEDESENWMDVGRQYTERWHHQMQIRDAVGRPLLLEPRWLDPLLDVCVQALPVAYRDTPAPVGTVIRLEVEAGRPRAFRLVRDAAGWSIGDADNESAACTIRVSSDAAWRLLFNALDPAAAEAAVQVFGDAALARPLLSARAVIV